MEQKSTFGNRDPKLLARLERKKTREENHKRHQDQAKEEKEMLTMVLGVKESDGSVEEQTGEDFCEPPKQRKNSDRILLHVPRNIASTPQVVMTTDRRKISSNALNDIIASIIRESQGCVEDFVLGQMSTLRGRKKLSQMSTLRGRKKLRSLKFESVKENFFDRVG